VTRDAGLLGEFLKIRRGQSVRAEFGLPTVGRQRPVGLRREEVAYLAGVSITWYTWLEQGRDVTPSRQVLDALARTLRLSGPEHTYLLLLAGYSAPHQVTMPVSPAAPVQVQRLLDAQLDFPAYAITSDWGYSAWNRAYTGLYPNVTTAKESDRNLLWLLFTDPYLRALLPDWERTLRYNVAAFRAAAGPRLAKPPFAPLVRRLFEASESFRALWQSHPIEALCCRERLFHHPVAGDLHLEQHNLTLADHPDLHVVIYAPTPATDTARLRRLLDVERDVITSPSR
jgi:transcriptional regulator with XRE-family HTH domain